jgi:hypothetical protein
VAIVHMPTAENRMPKTKNIVFYDTNW